MKKIYFFTLVLTLSLFFSLSLFAAYYRAEASVYWSPGRDNDFVSIDSTIIGGKTVNIYVQAWTTDELAEAQATSVGYHVISPLYGGTASAGGSVYISPSGSCGLWASAWVFDIGSGAATAYATVSW